MPIVHWVPYAVPVPGQEILERTYCPTEEDRTEFSRESEKKVAFRRVNRPDLEIQCVRTGQYEMAIIGVPKQSEEQVSYNFNQETQDVLSELPPSEWPKVGRDSDSNWEGLAEWARAYEEAKERGATQGRAPI